MRALYTATTGMLGQQLQIDVTSNNISNVNTFGFLPTTALTQSEDFLPMIRQKAKKPTARSHTGNRLR